MQRPKAPAAGVQTPPEKRRDLRIPLRVLRVETEMHGDVFFGYATNVSLSGLFIQTPNPKKQGTKVRVKFELPGSKKAITCVAAVAWSRNYQGSTGGESPGMGIRFEEISPEDSQEIQKFVEEASRG